MGLFNLFRPTKKGDSKTAANSLKSAKWFAGIAAVGFVLAMIGAGVLDGLETIGIALMTAGFMALIGFGILAVGSLIQYQIQKMKFQSSSTLSESNTEDSSYHYAGFWNRFVALLTDIVVLSPVILVFQLGLPLSGNPASDYLIAKYASIIPVWLYFAFMESSSYQATLGKRLMGLCVVTVDGNRITFGRATGRYFGRFLSAIPMGIGFLMAAFTRRKQALHDMLATCLVIKRDNPAALPLDKAICDHGNYVAHKEPQSGSRMEPVASSYPVSSDKTCSSCKTENSSDAKFCRSCGNPFYKKCPECKNKSVVVVNEFCSKCGTNIRCFIATQKTLDCLHKYYNDRRFNEFVEIAQKFDVTQFPGSKGRRMSQEILNLKQRAQVLLEQECI